MGNNILNPLEKELLIKLYRRSPGIKFGEFCRINNVSDAAFKSWIKKYDEDGLEGLYRSKKTPELLPEGVDRTTENYKRELIKTRIELERVKKNYTRSRSPDGKQMEYVTLSDKTTR
jgi:transposase-like protein